MMTWLFMDLVTRPELEWPQMTRVVMYIKLKMFSLVDAR